METRVVGGAFMALWQSQKSHLVLIIEDFGELTLGKLRQAICQVSVPHISHCVQMFTLRSALGHVCVEADGVFGVGPVAKYVLNCILRLWCHNG